jgi:hypothetical protein
MAATFIASDDLLELLEHPSHLCGTTRSGLIGRRKLPGSHTAWPDQPGRWRRYDGHRWLMSGVLGIGAGVVRDGGQQDRRGRQRLAARSVRSSEGWVITWKLTARSPTSCEFRLFHRNRHLSLWRDVLPERSHQIFTGDGSSKSGSNYGRLVGINSWA